MATLRYKRSKVDQVWSDASETIFSRFSLPHSFCGIYEMQIHLCVCELVRQFLKAVKFSILYPKYEHVMLWLYIVYCSVPFDYDYCFHMDLIDITYFWTYHMPVSSKCALTLHVLCMVPHIEHNNMDLFYRHRFHWPVNHYWGFLRANNAKTISMLGNYCDA